MDDPEHISLDGYNEQLLSVVNNERKEIKRLLDSSDNGRILKEGINTVILGKPNAGKSSLLNKNYLFLVFSKTSVCLNSLKFL